MSQAAAEGGHRTQSTPAAVLAVPGSTQGADSTALSHYDQIHAMSSMIVASARRMGWGDVLQEIKFSGNWAKEGWGHILQKERCIVLGKLQ